MQYSSYENTSLHENVIQFFLLQTGLPFFHYGFPLKYTLGHGSLVPKKTNIKKTKHVPIHILTLQTSHIETLAQTGFPTVTYLIFPLTPTTILKT